MSEITRSETVTAILESGTLDWPPNLTIVGHDFDRGDLRWVKVNRVTFIDCTFRGTWMDQATFDECTLDRCDLTDIRAVKTQFVNCDFESCSLRDSCISEGSLRGSSMVTCSAEGSDWSGIDMWTARFKNCTLSSKDAMLQAQQSQIGGTVFAMSDLSGSSFEFAQGYNIRIVQSNLVGANCNRVQVSGLALSRSNLEGAHFEFAYADSGFIEFSYMDNASFADARFTNFDFYENFKMVTSNRDGFYHTMATSREERINGTRN